MTDRYAASRQQHERARATLAGGVATAFRSGQRPIPRGLLYVSTAHEAADFEATRQAVAEAAAVVQAERSGVATG